MVLVLPGNFNEEEFRKQFEVYFKQYFRSLYFHALSFIRDEDVAKDIVHDVFITVWERRSDIDFSQPLLPYLLSLTRNRCLNHLEHLKVKVRHEEQAQSTEPFYLITEDLGHEELIRAIMERIASLPDRCRDVMQLYLVDGKKYKEIADTLNISVNTIKTHISNGLKILRDEFPASLLLWFTTYRKII